MQPTTIVCPHCFTSLRTSEDMLGRLVNCPKCHQPFLGGGRQSRRTAASSGGNWAIILAFVAALALVLGGGAASIFFLMNSAQKDTQQQAKGDNQTPPKTNLETPPASNNSSINPKPPVNPPPPVNPNPLGEPNMNPPAPPPEPMTNPPAPPPEPKINNPTPPSPPLEPKNPNPPPNKPDPVPPPVKNPENPTPKKGKNVLYLVSKEQQDMINKAIDKGVDFVKKSQNPDGSWDNATGQPSLGYTALPALTLLECGVPKTDPAVQKAWALLRQQGPTWIGPYNNYDLALSILFLDKLGAPQDKELIRFMALRLIAAQRPDGGWNYSAPSLTNQEAFELLGFLQATRPDPHVVTEDGKLVPVKEPGKDKDKLDPLPKGPVEPIFKPFNANLLSQKIQNLPVVKLSPEMKSKGRKAALKHENEETDNSNTQFAVMALWMARKYGIPVERTLALVDQRFISSQNHDGGWGYQYLKMDSTPSMTCVGLIGLAAGHGSHKESLGSAWVLAGGKSIPEDAAIKKGLNELARSVGEAPQDWTKKVTQGDLYFVWSVERVSVLYNLRTIGGKDWYSWAAQMLVSNQHLDGSWKNGNYSGQNPPINTSLALLTLKRANLVPDLTEALKEYIPIEDPGLK